jgi:superfamily II DNA or RNA helicase
VRKHSVMVGDRVLYYAAQLSHAQRFARARQAEGIQAYVVPDPTPQRTRTTRINPLTGKPYNKPQTGRQAAKRKA